VAADDDFEALMRAEGVTPLDRRKRERPPPPAAPPAVEAPAPPPERAREPTEALTRAQAALEEAEARVSRLRTERDQLQRRLTAARATHAPQPVTASEVLAARGLDEVEGPLALAMLLERFGDAIVPTLQLTDREPLAALLRDRLVLTARPDEVGPGSVALPVPEDRCELGSGSDLRGAWRSLAEACEAANVDHVCIVGGSPNYRRQLRELATTTPRPSLHLVPGVRPLRRHKVEAAVRRADHVVIWGGTILAHTVSQPFVDAGGDKVVTISHRGLSGMLHRLREHVEGAATG